MSPDTPIAEIIATCLMPVVVGLLLAWWQWRGENQ